MTGIEILMSTDTALIEKREELKRRLATGEYKTLVDVFLSVVDRLFRTITRRSKPLPIWLVTVYLFILVFLLVYVSIYVTGEWLAFLNPIAPLGLFGTLLVAILSGALAIVSAVAINQYIRRVFVLWHDEVLDATESLESLEEVEGWLEKTCNKRIHFLVTIIGALIGGSYLIAIISKQAGVFVGYGSTFTFIILSMFSSAFLYLFLMVILLSARLRRYQLKLFAADPSSSELVSRLSSELSFIIYFVAIYAAILTLINALSRGAIPFFSFLLVLFLWLPIIAMFVLNQTSLSNIIRRAKWKTLNEIQAKVEKLQTSKNFGNQETMDAIKRLMDYHDRVKATRDSALDFTTYLGFINSLLLPLLAFIIGNLDLVLNLFAIKP
jgi:ABC-type multidrug transport system fused ATPase/permease subunit